MTETYITTKPVKHSPDGIRIVVWPVGTEVTGATGESLHRQGRARIKPGRKPAVTKPKAGPDVQKSEHVAFNVQKGEQ